jgi:hypothetical protein
MIVSLPKGRVSVVVPFDQRVIVPEPNSCVVPVMTLPLLSRSVMIDPLPNGRVVLVDPSERFVIVPEPNGCVVPVRGLVIERLGGDAAKELVDASTNARTIASEMSSLAIFRPHKFTGPVCLH